VKAYGGVDVHIHFLMTPVLLWGEWSGSRSSRFVPGDRDIHKLLAGTEGWVGPRTSLENMEELKFVKIMDTNTETSIAQSVTSRYIDCCTNCKCM
jgi:hypothetical protein